MSNPKEEQFQPTLQPLMRTEDNKPLSTSFSHHRFVPILNGQPVLIDRYPPQKIEGEVVVNFCDLGEETLANISILDEEDKSSALQALTRQKPSFPTKPDEIFGTGITNRVILPFDTKGEFTSPTDQNTILERERRTAIANVLAKIVVRIQHEENSAGE